MKKILVLLFLGLFAFSATAFAATGKKAESSKASKKDGKAKCSSKTEIRPLSQKAKDDAAK